MRMFHRAIPWLVLAGLFAFWLYADDILPPETTSAPEATVRDGDTLVVAGKTFRLYGMDAPEYKQLCQDAKSADWPCGKAARLQLASLVAPGAIVCTPRAVDKYGRDVAQCASATVPDLAEAMVQAGLAISPAARGTAVYEAAEAAAKEAKRGIWQGKFILPSEWRNTHPRGSP
jgi:endonuclease YncB( thermonuclease family)